jgi:hypothetical protein
MTKEDAIVITFVKAQRLENGWLIEVIYRKGKQEVDNVKQFLLTNINDIPLYLQAIEKKEPLPLTKHV